MFEKFEILLSAALCTVMMQKSFENESSLLKDSFANEF